MMRDPSDEDRNQLQKVALLLEQERLLHAQLQVIDAQLNDFIKSMIERNKVDKGAN